MALEVLSSDIWLCKSEVFDGKASEEVEMDPGMRLGGHVYIW